LQEKEWISFSLLLRSSKLGVWKSLSSCLNADPLILSWNFRPWLWNGILASICEGKSDLNAVSLPFTRGTGLLHSLIEAWLRSKRNWKQEYGTIGEQSSEFRTVVEARETILDSDRFANSQN